jgi:hypothetical protein
MGALRDPEASILRHIAEIVGITRVLRRDFVRMFARPRPGSDVPEHSLIQVAENFTGIA